MSADLRLKIEGIQLPPEAISDAALALMAAGVGITDVKLAKAAAEVAILAALEAMPRVEAFTFDGASFPVLHEDRDAARRDAIRRDLRNLEAFGRWSSAVRTAKPREVVPAMAVVEPTVKAQIVWALDAPRSRRYELQQEFQPPAQAVFFGDEVRWWKEQNRGYEKCGHNWYPGDPRGADTVCMTEGCKCHTENT